MASYGEPDWATPGGGGGAPTTQDTGLSSDAVGGNGVNGTSTAGNKSGMILTVLSVLNIAMAALMTALGVLTLLSFGKPFREVLSEAFLAVYMILFAGLLCVYEVMWWMSMPKINKIFRKNFGFMYGLRGKGLYLIFVAFLCIGLGSDNLVRGLTWVTGISYLVIGILHIFIVCVHPEISAKYQAPTAGLDANDSVVTRTPNPV
mmetsp:Transcript_34152/g.38859  ORF Transcript_34152/g.38859 Transcript_34152/m.38859 type:complete len:204 (+) Transcript_34152:154-765(+)|eukprot:CAMPEP_0194131132 /NCGR_PEP_ID=MMETSP0152-20130528/1960_1 /TAXON_ID=1049557 /ORGANISM="Thalassiothrix antarctica, Strain L6-D1" /LENGTH=203 /DNA_ID=CAMNT_0038825811 /DNA_START=149 /DNA_END=760 /DNA_ORIENTATION=+